MKRKWIWITLVLLVAIGIYLKKQFSIYYEKVGEVSFYNRESVELKLVRIFENLPLHFVGNTHQVLCKSPRTLGASGHPKYFIEAGWKQIPTSTLIFDRTEKDGALESLAERAKKVYFFQNKALVILTETGIYFSVDQCSSIMNWDTLRNLSKEIKVTPTPEYEKCLKQREENTKKGLANYGTCDYFNFSYPNQPIFDEIVVETGKISFRMTAKALKSPLKIVSMDSGKTWQTSTL